MRIGIFIAVFIAAQSAGARGFDCDDPRANDHVTVRTSIDICGDIASPLGDCHKAVARIGTRSEHALMSLLKARYMCLATQKPETIEDAYKRAFDLFPTLFKPFEDFCDSEDKKKGQ